MEPKKPDDDKNDYVERMLFLSATFEDMVRMLGASASARGERLTLKPTRQDRVTDYFDKLWASEIGIKL